MLLIDAQLLVLLVAGQFSVDLIGSHKRLRAYSVADYDLLLSFIGRAQQIVVTPHTLTEASNLIRLIAEPYRAHLTSALGAVLGGANERWRPLTATFNDTAFARLGLTDCVVLAECADGLPLLTADAELYAEATTRGIQATNFNHLREAAGLA